LTQTALVPNGARAFSTLKICVAESKEKGFSKVLIKSHEKSNKSEKIRRTCGQLKTADFVKNI